MVEICKFKRLHKLFELPAKATAGSACFDLRYCGDDPFMLRPLERAGLSLGFSVEVPVGFELQIRPRSGLALKHGITILNSPATIDADFRGPCFAILIMHSSEEFVVKPGMKICQGLVSKLSDVELVLAEELSDTERGAGGFGSTGL